MRKGGKEKTILGIGLGRFVFAAASAPVLAVCGVLTGQSWYEILLAVFSVVTITYLSQGKRAGCALGTLWSLGYAAVYAARRLVGLAFFNCFVSFPVYAASFFTWKRHRVGHTVATRRLSPKGWALMVSLCALGFAGCTLLLRKFGLSSAPLLDSLSLSLASSALALLLLRYTENWWFAIAADVVKLALWAVRAAANLADLNFLLIAAVLCAVNIVGLITWLRLHKAGQNEIAER